MAAPCVLASHHPSHPVSAWSFRNELLDEELAVQLRPSLRAAGDEAYECLADLDRAFLGLEPEQPGQRLRLRLRVVREQVELGQAQIAALRQELLDPVAGRGQVEAGAHPRGDERAPAPPPPGWPPRP